MTPDTMRRIDQLAGMPLCAVVSGALKLLRLFRPETPAAPKRILFIELSEMGSTILSDPAMRKAQSVFDAELFFVIFDRNKASLGFLNTVAERNIFTLREDSLVHLAVDTVKFFGWARRNGIDTAIDLELFSRFTALLTGLCGAVNRVGFFGFHNEGLYRGDMLTHRVANNPHIHMAKNFVALINALASPAGEVPYSKTLIGDDETRIAQAPVAEAARAAVRGRVAQVFPAFDAARHRLMLVNPNASEMLPQRRWAAASYATVVRRMLTHHPDLVVLITGAPSERAEADELCRAVGDARCCNFAGAVPFDHLTALYSQSAAMVTNDSGPGHFSAVTGMPTVVLFGPETPALYGPLGNATAVFAGLACSPCVSAANHRKTPCNDAVCMRAISPDQVVAALEQALAGGFRG